MDKYQLAQYFERIKLDADVSDSLESLRLIQRAQHKTMPFENFDIINGKGINLDPEKLFNKLVINHRGGYCQELNGLLFNVLTTIGFKVRPLLARVDVMGTPTGRGHRVNLVTLDGQDWIVDSGFGTNTPRAPIPVILNETFETDHQIFRLIEHTELGIMMQLQQENEWINVYSLDMEHVCENDIEYANHYTATSPKSFFTFNAIGAIATDDGLVTLLNQTLKITQNNATEEIVLNDEASYFDALQTYLGIKPAISYAEINALFR